MRSHGTSARPERQSREVHQFYFREEIGLPKAVFDLLLAKKLTATDISLYSIISVLNHPQWGCYASNRYIAGLLGMSTRHVQYRIEALISLDLIERNLAENGRSLRPVNKCTHELPVHPPHEPPVHPNKSIKKKHLILSPSGDGSTGDDDMVGLIDIESPEKTKCSVAPVHLDYADRLHSGLVAAGKASRRWSKKSWAMEFSRLNDEVSDIRIWTALKWYLEHIKDKYSPQAWCGKTFRTKFIAIEACMQRWLEKNPTVTIETDTESTLKRLRCMRWPKGSDAQLPVVTQLSVNNIIQFRTYVKSVMEKECKWKAPSGSGKRSMYKSDVGSEAERLYLVHLRDHQDAAQKHLTAVWKSVHNWKDWRGDLMNYVWTAEKFNPANVDHRILKILVEGYHESHKA